MFCNKCGKNLLEGSAFCEKCGAPVKPDTATANSRPTYTQAAPNRSSNTTSSYRAARQEEMTVGAWLLTWLIVAIPIAGIVMLFVWAFGSETIPAKRTYARAALIALAIGVGLAILFAIISSIFVASIF